MASKNSVTRQEVEREKNSNIQWRQSCVGLWETWRLFRYENVLLFKHKIFATNARRSNVFTCLVLHNNKNINVKFSRSKIFFFEWKETLFCSLDNHSWLGVYLYCWHFHIYHHWSSWLGACCRLQSTAKIWKCNEFLVTGHFFYNRCGTLWE